MKMICLSLSIVAVLFSASCKPLTPGQAVAVQQGASALEKAYECTVQKLDTSEDLEAAIASCAADALIEQGLRAMMVHAAEHPKGVSRMMAHPPKKDAGP